MKLSPGKLQVLWGCHGERAGTHHSPMGVVFCVPPIPLLMSWIYKVKCESNQVEGLETKKRDFLPVGGQISKVETSLPFRSWGDGVVWET